MALALGMPVKELLATHSSLELREYMAYESHVGPLGPRWQNDQLAEINYMIQWTNYLLGAWVTEKGKKNPVPEPMVPFRFWVVPQEHDEESEE